MIATALLACTLLGGETEQPAHFKPIDVFDLEVASDPRIAHTSSNLVYVRRFFDVMTDRSRSNLWTVSLDGINHRPLTTGNQNDHSPRWSPKGDRILYSSNVDGTSQIYVRWMDTGQTAKLTNLTSGPSNATWSPDGLSIAFTMFVEDEVEPLASMPSPPEGAEWAPRAKVITSVQYRADGGGFLTQGHTQLFVIPREGGTPRQVTSGDFDVSGEPAWSADGASILFSSNRREDADYEPLDSELYEVSIADGTLIKLTDRYGPDSGPLVSPDGKLIAYFGFDDRHMGHQNSELYLMNRDGSEPRSLTQALDRGIDHAEWAIDNSGLFVSYSDHGNTKIAFRSLDGGPIEVLAGDVGGTSLGRPYSSGSFTVSNKGVVAFTQTSPSRPADIAITTNSATRRLTQLNEDLLAHKTLGAVEEIEFTSSHDELPLQGWIVKPPGFEDGKQYPLILEIHGGPFADYGDRFTTELQLYAAAGYVVLYMNPRGSTSYGSEFADEIHHAYPGFDYDDLMSGVDAVLARGYVDTEQLFVTGGSGGGVLSAWIVGKTDRFAAAVVAKPVINWLSFALTADFYTYFHQYWFPGLPWDHLEHYWKRSPLSLVGNVTTPTMLLTGEVDYRTPMSESEQFYQALKLMKVEAALVRIPEASHGITARPSNLIAKVAHVLAWFEKYRKPADK